MEQDLAEVRERANLVEVISAHTQLRKAGPRTFKGLCPFHQEKTPSFTVDPAKQVYYCFGCGAGGDVFDFLRGAEGLSFAEAAERPVRQHLGALGSRFRVARNGVERSKERAAELLDFGKRVRFTANVL